MPSHFSLEYYDPPADLSRHILTTFWFVADHAQIEDRHPGALGQLFIFPRGSGIAHFSDRSDHVGQGAYLFSGFSAAIPIHVSGPWHAIGASLSPLGWAALTGKAASTYFDRMFPAQELLGSEVDDFAQDVVTRYRRGSATGAELCEEIAGWIGARLKPIPQPHEVLIEKAIGWLATSLNPEVDGLFEVVGYSRRQTERLVERYFGLPPAALARKYRGVRAAALLSQETLSDEAESEIASAFTDQSHLIREIRNFCGYTPSRLGGPADPLFQTLLQMKNFDRLEQFRAIGSNHADLD